MTRSAVMLATTFYHDLAGWVMIPLALVLYWLEIRVLSRLLIETKHEAPPVLDLVRIAASASRGRDRDQGLQTIGSLNCVASGTTEDRRVQHAA